MNIPFNKELINNFKKLKDKDEQFLWVGKPQFKSFIANYLWKGIIGAILIGIVFYVQRFAEGQEGVNMAFIYVFLGFIFISPVFSFFNKIFSYSNLVYGFSDKRIIMKSGIFGMDFKTIEYDKIVNIDLNVNFLDKYLKTGSINISTGIIRKDEETEEKLEDNWIHIENPYEVFKALKKVMLDIKTDYSYPNAKRPETNPGYNTKYKPK